MKSEDRIADERRARLRVLPGGLLDKKRTAKSRASKGAGRWSGMSLAWRLFFLGVFVSVLAAVMLAYVHLILRF